MGGAHPAPTPSQQFEAVNVATSREKLGGKTVQRVTKSPTVTAFDEPTYARLVGSNFHNGTIEVRVLSRLLPGAPALARGFIGLAFRINAANSQFESLYLRPANGRADNQLQRNHAVQYFSYPDYRFERLRKEAPGQYETYADLELGKWTRLRLVVHGAKAELFLNDNKQPTLLVNDLKHGPDATGGIGLWVDVGTEGFFSDLKITPTP
ncbi:MAG: hypothetical protein EOO59_00075 [Hymenobacter sp.]|nr:MAG: hypothetical protein EOO59_00075 [Hymenobacter sp.]